jgi:hypothetical protein
MERNNRHFRFFLMQLGRNLSKSLQVGHNFLLVKVLGVAVAYSPRLITPGGCP